MQFFKGDAIEKKYYDAGKPIMDGLSLQRDEMFDDAYACQVLGNIIWESKLSPLTNAITQDIFRESFSELVQSFIEVGTFESYLSVFKKIFGEEVGVQFEVPAPGKLNILIEAEGIELFEMMGREIVDDAYDYFEITDHTGDPILLQTVKGFQSQAELERMLFEMVPAGIFTNISLTIGGI